MSTGKQTPLGVNVTAAQLQNLGFYINPIAASYMGASKVNNQYTFGKLVNDTCLKPLVYAINDAYNRSIKPGSTVGSFTGSIAGDTLTVSAVSSGKVLLGSILSGSDVISGTRIVSQVTGTIGGIGTYVLNTFQNIGSTSLTASGIVTEWHTVSLPGTWSSFLNNYAIWSGVNTAITTRTYSASVAFPRDGTYTFTMQADDYMAVLLDFETPILVSKFDVMENEQKSIDIRVKNGIHTVSMIITNYGGTGGGAVTISNTDDGMIWNSRNGLAIIPNNGSPLVPSGYVSGTGMPVTAINGPTVSNANYDAITSIGKDVMPALGNCPPNSYINYDPSGKWWGQATTGYYLMEDPAQSQGQTQTATWIPYNTTNTNVSVTQWGYYRLFALQAWNEFNWNGDPLASNMPEYKDFTASFLTSDTFLKFVNTGINSFADAPEFLKGVYSNMNDLISADITGISLATRDFGADCIALGRAINLSKIQTFGLPSVLLQTIKQNKILTPSLSYALLASGLTVEDVDDIANENISPVSKDKEQKIYGAFLAIMGRDLEEILFALNCKTTGLETLADLLNLKKIFPNSYRSLTVPLYNANPGPTNSKTYYPIYNGDSINPSVQAPEIVAQVGEVIPPGEPPVIEPEPPVIPPPIIEVLPEPPPVVYPPDPITPSPVVTLPIQDIPVPPQIQPIVPTPPVAGGGCVALESYIPFVEIEKLHNGRYVTQAWMLEQEHKISLGDIDLSVSTGKVLKTLNDYQPCVRIVTESGISLVCSTTARIGCIDGFSISTETLGKKVAVMRDEKTSYENVVDVVDVGMKFVRVIDTGDNSFWAGENNNVFMLHHNVRISENDFIRKV